MGDGGSAPLEPFGLREGEPRLPASDDKPSLERIERGLYGIRETVRGKAKVGARSGAGEGWSTERNIVITGPGRSGTTLTCHLLNKLPDTVAVNESIAPPGKYADRLPDTGAVADGIRDFYTRESVEEIMDNLG